MSGVEISPENKIKVNENDRTNVENIYAIGDIAELKPKESDTKKGKIQELQTVAVQAGTEKMQDLNSD